MGFMIVAAFAAIAVAYANESLALGVIAGIVSAMALAALLAVFNLRLRANIFIAGIAVTFLAAGAKRSESGQKRRRLPGRARLEQECRKAVGRSAATPRSSTLRTSWCRSSRSLSTGRDGVYACELSAKPRTQRPQPELTSS